MWLTNMSCRAIAILDGLTCLMGMYGPHPSVPHLPPSTCNRPFPPATESGLRRRGCSTQATAALQVVIDIDGDGSFLMNCQELATIFIEKLDVKCFIMNNQHLGMVVQWEDRFYKKNRAHTYLGHRVSFVLPSTHATLCVTAFRAWNVARSCAHIHPRQNLGAISFGLSACDLSVVENKTQTVRSGLQPAIVCPCPAVLVALHNLFCYFATTHH